MIPEQIKQLAALNYSAKYINPENGDTVITADTTEAEAFIKGYTTCQQTEAAELQKEIERLKGLIEFSYRCDQRDMGIHEDEIDHSWEYYKQQNNL